MNYILDGSTVIATETRDNITNEVDKVYYFYDSTGAPVGFEYNGKYYYYETNLQGDIVKIYSQGYISVGNPENLLVASYTYDDWGRVIGEELHHGCTDDILSANIFRYRGYIYDSETDLYYLQSRYYDSETCRFLNADSVISCSGESVHGYNLYSYCFNNPIAMDDTIGEWPKWLTGALNVVSGVAQMVAGAALGAVTSWTGVGAVAAGFLIINGSATAAQGTGQIVNHVTKSNVMREDNVARTGVQEVGRAIGGDTGAKVAGGIYDVAVVAANLYAGKVSLEKSMPKIIESKVFSANNGYGFKVGKNIEMFYRNPNAAGGPGGTIFSYKGPLGKFRIDWDPAHGFHCHPPGH